MTTLLIASRDGLFPKDGRGWATSASGRAHGLNWPFPSTLLGAIRTAWGREQERASGRTFTKADWRNAKEVELGRTVVLRRPVRERDPKAIHRVWPVPLDALFMPAKSDDGPGDLVRIHPVPVSRTNTMGREELPEHPDDERAREGLWRPQLADSRKPTSRPAWWPEEVFVSWLADSSADPRPIRPAMRGIAPVQRSQTHVAIQFEAGTAQDGLLFSYDVVEVLEGEDIQGRENDEPLGKNWHDWLIAADVSGWSNPPQVQIATVGGKRRMTELRRIEDGLFAPPVELLKAFDSAPAGLRLIVVTPLISEHGWLLPGFAAKGDAYYGRLPGIDGELVLRAANIGRPQHVSGWDLERDQPKRTRRLVPPGSVYHLVKGDGAGFTASEAQALWLAALGDSREEGFGRMVPGLWQPSKNITSGDRK